MTRNAELLEKARAGDLAARDALVGVLYPAWQRLAHQQMSRERPSHTLEATEVLNIAIMRVLRRGIVKDARHTGFLQVAVANEMGWVLAEHARKRKALKRGRDHKRVPLDEELERFETKYGDVEDLVRELKELEKMDVENARSWQALSLRIFGGHALKEIAVLLDVSPSAIDKDLSYARAALHDRLNPNGSGGSKKNRPL